MSEQTSLFFRDYCTILKHKKHRRIDKPNTVGCRRVRSGCYLVSLYPAFSISSKQLGLDVSFLRTCPGPSRHISPGTIAVVFVDPSPYHLLKDSKHTCNI